MKGFQWQRWLKVAISAVIFGALYYQLFQNEDVRQLWEAFLLNQASFHYGWLSAALLLVFANWGLESLKWQFLLRGIQSIGMVRAIKAILAGVALATITPGRIGEYGGRIWYLNSQVRLKGIIVTLVGSLGQILATILIGSVGIFYWLFSAHEFPASANLWFAVLLVMIAGLALAGYYRLKAVAALAEQIPWLRTKKKIIQAIRIFGNYGSSKLHVLLLLSVLRFVVYATQFVFVFWAFNAGVAFYTAFLLAAAIFLGQMLLPVPAIAELATRGNLAIYFFGMLSVNEWTVLSASVSLWVINLIIPAMAGALIFMFKKQEEL